MSGMFVIKDDELVEMTEQSYDSEDVLQTLLARYPNLMAGDQMNSDEPRKWLLVTREAGLPSEEGGAGRWSVDHLFLDQDGIPTLVEVKRSSDTRIRREVVGQMLDYAANAVVYWSVEETRSKYQSNCDSQGVDADQRLVEFLADRCDPDEFWNKVKTNLEAGKVRMVFVADIIPPELQRIVEFLNTQMSPADVLAVQIKQYAGEGLKTLVPRVIGLTAAADSKKPRHQRQWDEASFLEELKSKRGAQEAHAAKQILDWAKQRGLRVWWGRGSISGSFYPMFDWGGEPHWTVSAWTSGTIEVPFYCIKKAEPFDDESMRAELLTRLNRIPGVEMPQSAVNGNPAIRLSVLVQEEAMTALLTAMDWLLDQVKKQDNASSVEQRIVAI